jgi:hypothetical protein
MALTTCDPEVPILTKPVTPGVLDQPVILTQILISSVTDDSHGMVVLRLLKLPKISSRKNIDSGIMFLMLPDKQRK